MVSGYRCRQTPSAVTRRVGKSYHTPPSLYTQWTSLLTAMARHDWVPLPVILRCPQNDGVPAVTTFG